MGDKYWCKTCSKFVDNNLKLKHESSINHLKNIKTKLNNLNKISKKNEKEKKFVINEISKIDKNFKKINNKREKFDDNKIKNIKDIKNEGADLTNWTTLKNETPIVDNKDYVGVKSQNFTASERELKEWDINGKQDLLLDYSDSNDDEDDSSNKIVIKIKKRNPIKK